MRQLAKRPRLDTATRNRLAAETKAIRRAADRKAEAKKRYENARGKTEENVAKKAKETQKARKKDDAWFEPVIQALKELAAPRGRCMYCGGSEGVQVEHYRPQAFFPQRALSWRNLLFVCGECNRRKLNHFPPVTEAGARLINPVDDNVWDYFTLDEFGILTPIWRVDLDGLDPRAVSTLEHICLNREGVQEVRLDRIRDLSCQVEKELNLFTKGEITRVDLEAKVRDWRDQPFQPDVADFFLNGPGKTKQPFAKLFAALTG